MAYRDLLSQEHQKPLLSAWVDAVTEGLDSNRALLQTMALKFDLDTAVGQQLDFVGEWVGIGRVLDLPATTGYFSFDVEGLGWDQAPWYFEASPIIVPYRLDDDHYRMLLRAKVANNVWDGSVPGAYRVWGQFYPDGKPFRFFIQDLGNMEMLQGFVGTDGPVTVDAIALLRSGALGLKPVGVRVQYAFLPDTAGPMFAFDLSTDEFAGWDTGSWATVVSS